MRHVGKFITQIACEKMTVKSKLKTKLVQQHQSPQAFDIENPHGPALKSGRERSLKMGMGSPLERVEAPR